MFKLTQNNNIKIKKSQHIIFILFLALILPGFIAILMLNISMAIKIILTFFIAFLPFFILKPVFFLYFIFLVTPSLRIISQTEKIIGQINFNAIMQFSIIFFGLIIVLFNINYLIKIIKRNSFILVWLLFILFAGVSLFYAGDYLKTGEELIRTLSILSLFIVTLILTKNKKDAYRLLAIMVIGAIIPVIVGFWQLFTNTGWFDSSLGRVRIYGTLIHPATFSFYLLSLIPINYAFLKNTTNNKKKFFYFLIISIFSFLIFASLTRGAWVAFIAMFLVYGLTKNRKAVLFIGIILFLIYLFNPIINQRVNDIFQPKYNSSFQTRINVLERTLPALKQAPIIGYGFGSFEAINLKYNEEAIYYESLMAHNDYLRIIIELGIVGLLTYLLLLILLLLKLYKIYKNSSDFELKNLTYGLIILWIGGLAISAGDNFLRTIPVQYIFWGYTGALLALYEKSRCVKNNHK